MKSRTPSEILAELPVPPEDYAIELVTGVERHAQAIDEAIGAHANAWAIERMPVVDRQLLRLSTYELVHRSDVPFAVAIDEAIELAKQYSTEESGRFINGVLAAIAAETRKGD